MNKKGFLFLAFVILTFVFGYIKAEQGDYATLGYDTPNGYAFWRVDSSGYLKPGVASTLDIGTSALPVRNMYVGGLTVTGTVTGTGAVTQSTTTYTGGINLWSRTIAQLNALIPSTTGQMVYCSDCGAVRVVISTGSTAVAQWAIITSTVTRPV